AQARLHPVVEPKSFEDWVSNQFGHRLFEIFFKTYTEKVWGISTRALSADWAGQRIRGLNLVEVIRNALLPAGLRGGGEQAIVKTLVDSFRYPRLGAGQCGSRWRCGWPRPGIRSVLVKRWSRCDTPAGACCRLS